MARLTAKQRLNPFGELYCEMLKSIEETIHEMPDDELEKLLHATHWPTATNCWWAVYAAAPIVADAARGEKYRRTQSRSTSSQSR